MTKVEFFTEHMQALEKSPERVRKFFQDACVKYAA